MFYDKLVHTQIDGKDVMMILSDDGTLYNVKPKQPIFDKEKNNRRFDRITKQVLSNYREMG